MFRKILLLTVAFVPCNAFAQSTAQSIPGRLTQVREPDKNAEAIVAAVSGPSIRVTKTAFVDGAEVRGEIRITNTGGQPATVTAIVDYLEVHFPRGVAPPAHLAGFAGSTPGWFRVADILGLAVPAPIAPLQTATVPYSFPLCEALDFAGANSMRNVVRVTVTSPSGSAKTVTTRSVSFPPPTLDCQACCLPNGDCTDTVPAACAVAAGLSQGSGTDCATTECTQACCLGDGTCSDETLDACGDDGGEALGLGTDCATTNPTCRGACCVTGVGCIDDVAGPTECGLTHQGVYLGNDTACASEIAACPTGACCEGGTGACRDTFDLAGTLHMSEGTCQSGLGGSYLGDGTTCATTNPTCRGACCVTGVGCIDDVAGPTECGLTHQGVYLGNDTACASEIAACPTGACCEGGTGACRDTFDLAGTLHMSEGTCQSGLGGSYLGDGTTCATTNPTCRGACCVTGVGCIDDVAGPTECGLTHQGVYLGNDTACASEIAACPTGACCEGGTGACRDTFDLAGTLHMSEGTCQSGLGGSYLGDGTTCATTNPTCRGACCVTGVGCIDDVAGPTECGLTHQGVYLGNDTACASEIAACPTGACCEGGTGACRDTFDLAGTLHMSEGTCQSGLGGSYLGDGTTCAGIICTEACCFRDGGCDDLLPGECTGNPQGPGTACTDLFICQVSGL